MTIERTTTQIILTFDKTETNNKNLCSICSTGTLNRHTVKPITMENGVISYLLAQKINGNQYCMKCSQSIKNLARNISKKYVVEAKLTFHTVELQSYTHYTDPFTKEYLYLKPDNDLSMDYFHSVRYDRRFQFDRHPYSLPDYSNWARTLNVYKKDKEREEFAYDNLHDQIFLLDNQKDFYINEAAKRFFINLADRLEREERWRKNED